MRDLFPRAIDIGLSVIKSWLPDGKQSGDEWCCRNPTRNDEHAGNFSVNLRTGKWADFAEADAAGNDAVSLYAYLNWDRLDAQARQKNPKNLRGQIMAEAAEEILTKYDPTYFPSAADKFVAPPEKRAADGDTWAGWSEVAQGTDNPPPQDFSWYEKQWGKIEKSWQFTKKTKLVMIVNRFRDEAGKKQDRPFTIWSKGGEMKFRAKAPSNEYILWNLDELEDRPNDPVILFEGQKAASVIQDVLPEYVCVGWYGGTNAIGKQDWKPLVGREVWYPFDSDGPGRKALAEIRGLSETLPFKLHPVFPPLSKPKGWDLADAVAEGWTADQIREVLKSEEPPKPEKKYLEDSKAFDFRILGYSGDQIVFYPHGSRKVIRVKPSGLTKPMLMTLMDRSKWREHFATENGIAWDEAQNHIIRKAERSPVFDPNLVRGVGAWDDCGKLVINDGETIFCDDEEYELFNAPGKYVYERGRRLPYTTHDPIDTEAAKRLIDMLSLIGWKRKADPMILAGWILLAPFGGALKWRPHVWMTAAKGSGKTWTMDNIVHPMVSDDFGRKGLGSSTSAGVRNELEGSSVPLTMDEMETDNDKQRETIEQTIRIFREGSGGTGSAATLHAAAEGGSKHWLVRSMALFASIASGLTHGADKDRFVNIDLSINPNEEHALRAERFNQLQNAVRETITESWARGFVHRTLKMWPDLTRCIDVMVQQVAEITGSRRDGDTIGTLMAGAWMSFNSKAPSAAEARKWLTEQGIGEMSSDLDQHKDELVCLEELMAARIEVEASNRRATIGSLINGWYNTEIKVISNEPDPEIKSYEAKKALEAYGIKLINRNAGARILIARKHPGIRKIMRDTAWSSSYTEILKRLDCCLRDNAGPARFCGIAFRHLELDAEKIFGQQEYEKMEEAPF